MRPTKDEGAVVDLVDVLLEKGVVLQADVVISVAEVPLIGVNLRAAIAGMATMTEHGFFEEWDREIRDRAGDRRSVGRRGTPDSSTAPVTGDVARSVGRSVADHEMLRRAPAAPGADDADSEDPVGSAGANDDEDEDAGDGDHDGSDGGTR